MRRSRPSRRRAVRDPNGRASAKGAKGGGSSSTARRYQPAYRRRWQNAG
jgi:hypothetical protein